MRRRTIAVSICIIFCSLSLIHPVIYGQQTIDIIKNNKEYFLNNNPDKEVNNIFEQYKKKVLTNKNPIDEIKSLIDNRNVKNSMQYLCGKKLVLTENIVFSNLPSPIKKFSLYQFNCLLCQGYQNESIQQIIEKLSIIDSYEINSIYDIDNIDELDFEVKDIIKQYYQKWMLDHDKDEINSLVNTLDIDNVTLMFIIAGVVFLSWIVFYAGAATLCANFAIFYTIFITFFESTIFGLAGTSIIGEITYFNDTPLYDYLAEILFNVSYGQLGHEFLEHIISSTFALLICGILYIALLGPLVYNMKFLFPETAILFPKLIFLLGAQAWFVTPVLISIFSIWFMNKYML